MYRRRIEPRENWQEKVESQGMHYHTLDGVPYWDESVYYEFTSGEIDALETATYELDRMCLEAVGHVLDENRLDQFLVPPEFHDYLRRSWERDEHTIYGRFDLAFDGTSFAPKLLEYNADTPTSLLEASVIQWYWLQDQFPRLGQFNSIHERLLEAWQSLPRDEHPAYFTSLTGWIEDYMNVSYLRDVATQAGLATEYIAVEDIGWDDMRRVFTDKAERPIRLCFKLYPWEWMQRDAFGRSLLKTECRWLEPPWKAILSNKAILPVLWELFPDSPYLLEASFEPLADGNYVKKPILGREGANIQVFRHGKVLLETEGPYDGPAVYQEAWPLPRFDGKYFACLGSWMVNGWACGLGIREDESMITGNLSRFVPHVTR